MMYRVCKYNNSYSNASFFVSLCRMHFSGFWGHKCLADKLISNRYAKSNIAPWFWKKSSTSRTFHAHDTWFYWSSENALHEHLSLSSGVWVWMEMLQLIVQHWKNTNVRVWIQLYTHKQNLGPLVGLVQYSHTFWSFCRRCHSVFKFLLFFVVFKWPVSFIKIEFLRLQTWTKFEICVFFTEAFKSRENSI